MSKVKKFQIILFIFIFIIAWIFLSGTLKIGFSISREPQLSQAELEKKQMTNELEFQLTEMRNDYPIVLNSNLVAVDARYDKEQDHLRYYFDVLVDESDPDAINRFRELFKSEANQTVVGVCQDDFFGKLIKEHGVSISYIYTSKETKLFISQVDVVKDSCI